MRSNQIQNIKKEEQMTPPKGYKHTELGVLPEDWEVVRLGDVCEINPKSLELPDTFIYIDLESVSKGKLCSVKYMKKTNAPSRAKRTLQKHDILFQMVRPYQKNNLYFILEGDYVASTGYAQIRTKQSSGFIFQYIHTQTFVEKVIKKCTGSNYPAINATDLSQIKIPLPLLVEQEKIAEILSTWDIQIQNLESLITEKQNLKKGLCQTLLTAKTRLKGFSEDWEVVRLGDILEYEQPTKYLVSNAKYDNSYTTPVLTAGKTFILGYTDEVDGIYTNLPIILFDDFTTASQYVDFPFKVKSSACKILKLKKKEFNLKIIFEIMQRLDFVAEDHKRYWISEYQNQEIFLPNAKEQRGIAKILSEADNEITLLEQKLESLKSQKKGLMQNLLNGKVRVKYG